MDSNERIRQLENQVRELSSLVHRLSADRQKKQDGPNKKRPRQIIKDDMRRNVDKVLGGEQGETLETRIGGIWLSRMAMVLLMTAVVLGARVTIYTDIFGAAQKLAITFAASAIALIYGIVWWRSKNIFSETILGAGLAGLYFALYGAFFVEGMQVLETKIVAAPVLALGLILLLAILHIRRSQATAGIAMFLVYYTVVASAMGGSRVDNVVYALICSAALAVAAVMFHIMHRWLLFSWAALIATYATYFFYFYTKPPSLHVTGLEYFWLSNGFLAICYIVFSVGCIFDARKTGEFRYTVGQMCGVNSAIFLTFTWFAIRDHYLAQEWLFRLSFSGMLLAFAVLAQTAGPRNNYLFQIFIAKALVMFTLAMQAYFSGDKLMVAMALECLGLALSYKRSGIVMFKVMGLGLLLITFIGCLFHIKTPGATMLWGLYVPSNWFCCAGSAIAFLIVSWFYERFIYRVRPEQRVVRGQWFLADTFLDVGGSTASLLNASAAAFILLTVTIADQGTQPQLPYILAGQAAAVCLVGLIMRAPQIEVAAVLLLIGAHVCYYIFLVIPVPGFEDQSLFTTFTILLALFTYIGAWFWERYLTRVIGGRPWEHHSLASIPYLAATMMLSSLIIRKLYGIDVPLAQEALGLILLMVGAVSGYTGVKASGLLAFIVAVGAFCRDVYHYQKDFLHQPKFLFYFFLFLMALVMAERLFVILQRRERTPSRLENRVRTALVTLTAFLGAGILRMYSSPDKLTIFWVILAVSAAALGAVFRESRYRWAAIIIFAATIIRAFQYDLRRLPPAYAFVSFAVLACASLVVTWSYSKYRQRMLKRLETNAGQDEPTKG